MNNDEEPHAPDATLLTELQGFIKKYVALPSDDHYLVLAVWVLHTWVFQAADVTPYLYVFSNGPSCGKTRLLEVLSCLARNARRADDMTAPVMFKLIARECPTILKDEIDTVWSGSRNEPQRQIFNTGYKKGGTAWREQARELIEFPTFCPKVLCGIDNGFMPATIRDRCIPIEMSKRKEDQKIERFSENRVRGSFELESLLDKIVAFTEAFYADVVMMAPRPMYHLSDRQDEISEPLLALSAVLSVEGEMRDALTRLFGKSSKKPPRPEQVVFKRIREAFGDSERIFTEDLCHALGPMYTGRALAQRLEPFGITPKLIRHQNMVLRGYTVDQFEDVFGRYLGKQEEDRQKEDEESDYEVEA